jgi:cobalamin biosynthesis protein CobT
MDSIFGDIAFKMIDGDLDIDLNEGEDHPHNDANQGHDHKNSHQDHIKVTEVRDVTEEEKNRNKIKETVYNERKKVSEVDKNYDDGNTVTDEDKNENISHDEFDKYLYKILYYNIYNIAMMIKLLLLNLTQKLTINQVTIS